MATLYELTKTAYELQTMLETGDIDEEVFRDTLEGMSGDEKIENVCKVIRNLEAQAAAFKAEKDRMADRQKTAENGVKRLKQSLLDYLVAANIKKRSAGLFTVSVGTSKAVNITNEAALPDRYFVPQEPRLDKTMIGNDLKANVHVEGAEIVENPFLRIR